MSIILISREHHTLGLDKVEFSINNKRYQYNMTSDVANKVESVAKYKAGKALNIAKKHGILINQVP